MSLDNLNLLDATLDDLADLKKFEPFPAGSYKTQVAWEFPEDDELVIVRCDLKLLECLDVPGVSEENMPQPGKTATFWMRLQYKDGRPLLWDDGTPNDQDQGRLKEILKAMAPVFNPDGALTNRELIEASQGAEVLVTLKVRASKKDKDVKFNEIKELTLAE